MLTALTLALLTQCDPAGPIVSCPSTMGGPLFEFAPATGAGMTGTCACTSPKGTKGEAMVFARASNAWCTKNSTTTGIVPGDMVECSSAQPRIMPGGDGSGGNGLLSEPALIQNALQVRFLENAAWTSTEAVTANTTASPSNAVDADTLNDTSAVAQSCTSQVITTSSATKHTVSVFLRAGTLAKAQLKMVGTGNAAGDCTASTTTLTTPYDRITCTSGAAYTGALTAVTVSVCVGTVVGDTGTVIAWGVNHSVSQDYLASFIDATAAPATRQSDLAHFLTSGINGVASIAASFVIPAGTHPAGGGVVSIQNGAAPGGPSLGLLMESGTFVRCFQQGGLGYMALGGTQSVVDRAYCWNKGGTFPIANCLNGKLTAFAEQSGNGGDIQTVDRVVVGAFTAALAVGGVVKRVCVDPNQTRCR